MNRQTAPGNKHAYNSGMVAFFLSGICSISSGVIISILRDRYEQRPPVVGDEREDLLVGILARSRAEDVGTALRVQGEHLSEQARDAGEVVVDGEADEHGGPFSCGVHPAVYQLAHSVGAILA